MRRLYQQEKHGNRKSGRKAKIAAPQKPRPGQPAHQQAGLWVRQAPLQRLAFRLSAARRQPQQSRSRQQKRQKQARDPHRIARAVQSLEQPGQVSAGRTAHCGQQPGGHKFGQCRRYHHGRRQTPDNEIDPYQHRRTEQQVGGKIGGKQTACKRVVERHKGQVDPNRRHADVVDKIEIGRLPGQYAAEDVVALKVAVYGNVITHGNAPQRHRQADRRHGQPPGQPQQHLFAANPL